MNADYIKQIGLNDISRIVICRNLGLAGSLSNAQEKHLFISLNEIRLGHAS